MKRNYLLLVFLFFLQYGFCQSSPAIFEVARKGTLSDIEALYKADTGVVNAIDQNGFSPLILACYRANTDVVTFLLAHQCDVNYVSNEGTALMAATVKGNLPLAKLLLNNGADPNLTNSSGMTALMYAVQFKSIEMVKFLLENKANKLLKNNEGKTAFEYAVFSNNETITNLLK